MTVEVQQAFTPLVSQSMAIIREFLAQEAALQGHKQTGRAAASMEIIVETTPTGVIGKVMGESYMLVVDAGVRPDKVRYRIQVMIDYFKRWGLSEKEATKAAWGTRTIHKREGIPTRRSYAFSKNGKRLGFIKDGATKAMELVKKLFEEKLDDKIDLVFSEREGDTKIRTITL